MVATSSLELGIDMGSIDLVLQVAAPPSVASGLQRIGRANHQVGGRSTGSIYPRTRTEVIDAAVVAEGEVAFALANAYLEAFGDTCMADIKANIKAYKARLRTMGR